jgi:hypothetical protein
LAAFDVDLGKQVGPKEIVITGKGNVEVKRKSREPNELEL